MYFNVSRSEVQFLATSKQRKFLKVKVGCLVGVAQFLPVNVSMEQRRCYTTESQLGWKKTGKVANFTRFEEPAPHYHTGGHR